jgi:Secretion system C-terminal sorting domain/HYR domain
MTKLHATPKPLNSIEFLPSCFSFLLVMGGYFLSLSNIQAQGGSFRTHTQADWGLVPKGNNTASYVKRNFKAAFPNGLTIGCTNKLVLTSAEAITDFLPSNSTAAMVLSAGIMTNPALAYNNVFAGQVVALKLNLIFDAYDNAFSSSTAVLKNMRIKTGKFAGKTLQEILQEAENVLGGCPSIYGLTELNEVVTKINENFDKGVLNKGFLTYSVGTAGSICTNDTEPPVFKEMPLTFTVFAEECYMTTWNPPVITDNCSAVTLTSNISLGECLPIGTHKVTMTATDASGNSSSYSFTITIEGAIYIEPLKTGSITELVAHIKNKTALLDWMNSNNDKTNYFVIQRNNALGEFEDIKTITARPLLGIQEYAFVDDKVKKDENSYRIKTVLKNGTLQYSSTKTVDIKNKDLIQVYPSPTATMVNIDLTPYGNQSVRLFLYDYLGQTVHTQFIQQVNNNQNQIDLSDLPSGRYNLSIVSQTQQSVEKMLFIGQ